MIQPREALAAALGGALHGHYYPQLHWLRAERFIEEADALLDALPPKIREAFELALAFAETEEALPEGWHFELETGAFDASGLYRATAHWVEFFGARPPKSVTGEWQPTPAAALLALTERLRATK